MLVAIDTVLLVGAGVTGSFMEGECCPSADGAMGSAASATFGTFFSVPLQGYRTSQHVVYRDLIGFERRVKLYLFGLFGLPVPAPSEAAQVRIPCMVPVAAAWARSSPATRIDRNGTRIVLREQCLADYKSRQRQEESALPISTEGPTASTLRGAGHGRVAQLMANGIDEPSLVGEPANPWGTTRSVPTSCLPMHGSSLTLVTILARTLCAVVLNLCLGKMRPQMMIISSGVSVFFCSTTECDTPVLPVRVW